MKTPLIIALLAASFSLHAQADQALAQSKNCMACHAVDKKLVGPSYKDVARQSHGQAEPYKHSSRRNTLSALMCTTNKHT
jgi:cytochrome c